MLMSIVLIYIFNGTSDMPLTLLDNLFHNLIETLTLWNDLILVLQMVPAKLLIDLIPCKYDLILKT